MRINRRRRALKARAFTRDSSQWQILLWGAPLLSESGPGFETEAEMHMTWNRHRGELMAECGPGERPYAFYRFDLAITDRVVHHWHDQIAVLLAHGLIDQEEAIRTEKVHHQLGPDAGTYARAFESLEGIVAMFGDGQRTRQDLIMLRELAGECEAAAAWHKWRGRPMLAEQYERRAATVRWVLEAEASIGFPRDAAL